MPAGLDEEQQRSPNVAMCLIWEAEHEVDLDAHPLARRVGDRAEHSVQVHFLLDRPENVARPSFRSIGDVSAARFVEIVGHLSVNRFTARARRNLPRDIEIPSDDLFTELDYPGLFDDRCEVIEVEVAHVEVGDEVLDLVGTIRGLAHDVARSPHGRAAAERTLIRTATGGEDRT